MGRIWIFCLVAFVGTGPGRADPDRVVETVGAMFDRMPEVVEVPDLGATCGAGPHTNPHIFYCTTGNTIFHGPSFAVRPGAAYEMAHLHGHAVQVNHGVADIALRTIINRRDEETKLRGWVERQVDCLAGVFLARAGLDLPDLGAIFGAEPFTGAHWGRNPVDAGPKVSIGLEASQSWLTMGYEAAEVAACSVGEFSAQIIVDAQR